METTLLEIGKQVPALAVLAGVVWMFLRGGATLMDVHATNIKELQSSYLVSMREIQAQNLEARAQSRVAITDNTDAMRDMHRALTELLVAAKSFPK